MAKAQSPVPQGFHTVTPQLIFDDAAQAIDWYKKALGAEEKSRSLGPDGKIIHALLTVRGQMLMLEAEYPTLPSRVPPLDGSSPVVIFVYVENVDAVIERAVAAGARVLLPVKNQFWGDRTGRIIDPSGHVWTIATRIEETSSAEREQRWSSIVKG